MSKLDIGDKVIARIYGRERVGEIITIMSKNNFPYIVKFSEGYTGIFELEELKGANDE